MLTKGDDYPIHQTPDPIAYAGSDPNFYDRYFFNGYSRDAEHFFAVALGVYPLRNVMDAAFCVVSGGVQHSVFASRVLGRERMDTTVGPIAVEVVEPLEKLRIVVGPNDYGVTADLLFEGRGRPFEEPRFQRRSGPRVTMDLTRLTQHGSYRGWIEVEGRRIQVDPARHWGVRDRSWGIRPVGEQIAAGGVRAAPQFYWQWAPLNFDDRVVLFATNEEADGTPWHANGVIAALGDAEPQPIERTRHSIEFEPGTRHARRAEVVLVPRDGPEHRIEIEPLYNFYMLGIGYGHPQWGHGHFRGDLEVGGETLETSSVDEKLPHFQHIQAVSRAKMGEREGIGVLEQLVIGPHAPSGFKEILDFA